MSGSGLDVWLHNDDGKVVVEHIQDVEPILEWNKQLRREDQSNTDGFKHKATIPNVIYLRWLDDEHRKGNTNLRLFTPEFDEIVNRHLEDPDWYHLRVDKPALQVGWSFKK